MMLTIQFEPPLFIASNASRRCRSRKRRVTARAAASAFFAPSKARPRNSEAQDADSYGEPCRDIRSGTEEDHARILADSQATPGVTGKPKSVALIEIRQSRGATSFEHDHSQRDALSLLSP
jgi:hypothetical protein